MDETKKLDELEAFEAEIASLEGKDGRWTAAEGFENSEDSALPPSSVVVSLSKRPILDKQPAGPLPKSVKPKKPKLTKSGKAAKIKALASSISSSLSRSTTLKKAKIAASGGSSSTSSTTTQAAPSSIISANPTINPQSFLVPNPSTNSFAPPTHPTNSYTTPHQTSTPASSSSSSKAKNKQLQKNLRAAAGRVWEDKTLDDWPENDFRIFCGDLGNEVNDNTLAKAFVRYGSFAKAKVIRDKRTQKTKGFGFVSFLDPFDCARALKEMNGKYIGNRPVKLRKSVWDRRAFVPTKRKRKKGKKKDAEENPEGGSPDPETAE